MTWPFAHVWRRFSQYFNPLLMYGGGFLSDGISSAFKQCYISFHCLFKLKQMKMTKWQYAMMGISLRHVILLLKYFCDSLDNQRQPGQYLQSISCYSEVTNLWLCLQELIEVTLCHVAASQAQNHMRSSCLLMLSLIMSSGTLVYFCSLTKKLKHCTFT